MKVVNRQPGRTSPMLSPTQIRWLGALIVCAQLPQAPHLPWWIAVFGLLLVALRFALLRRDRQRPDGPPARCSGPLMIATPVPERIRSRHARTEADIETLPCEFLQRLARDLHIRQGQELVACV